MQSGAPASTPSATGRLSAERTADLLDAVLALLGEVGYGDLTMDAIAGRAQMSKATLYRRWKGKSELVVEALRKDNPAPASIHTGSLRGDLLALADVFGSVAPTDGPLLAGLAHAGYVEPELGEALRNRLFDPFAEVIRLALDRAIERGEIPFGPAVNFCPIALMSMTPGRALIEGRPVTRQFLADFIDHVLLPSLRAGAPASDLDPPAAVRTAAATTRSAS